MTKKSKIFISGAIVSLAVAGTALALNNKFDILTKAEQQSLSVTWDMNNRTTSNHYSATTAAGNKLTCYGSNTQDGGDSYMVYFRNNGAGLYFDNVYQSITSVTITYKYASRGTIELHVAPSDSDIYTSNEERFNMAPDLSSGYNEVRTETFNVANPSDAHCLRIWSTNATTLYSITVNYLCE